MNQTSVGQIAWYKDPELLPHSLELSKAREIKRRSEKQKGDGESDSNGDD